MTSDQQYNREISKGLVLSALPGTLREICQITGMKHLSARRWTETLVKENLAHLYCYKQNVKGGKPTHYYSAGPAPLNFVPFFEKEKVEREIEDDDDFYKAPVRKTKGSFTIPKPHTLMALYGIQQQ